MLTRVSLLLGLASADQIFRDTPLTTELWQLVAHADETKTNEALEKFLYQNPDLATARSADKRGGLWWAWEYKNYFALGAFKAYGADPESKDEDDDGNTPKAMCTDEQECADLLKDVAEVTKGVLERKKAKEEKEEKEMDEEEDDDLDDDDDVRIHKPTPKKKKEDDGSLNVDVDEDEDEDL